MPEDMKILEVLANPIVDYLRKRYNPHTTIVITDNRVVVVEDVVSVPFESIAGISQVPTCELVKELGKREGVETHTIGSTASITVQSEGPAVVLSVID